MTLPAPAIIDALDALIGFDTTSDKSNLALIDWAEGLLRGLGADCMRMPAPDGEKASLFARFGPKDAAGWVLSGHTDTVPVADQVWTVPPFRLTKLGEKFYGRGTCDMKGYLACMMGLAPEIARAPLVRPIYFAMSFDEETGCKGVDGIIAHLQALPVRPMGCIVGEPSGMEVAIGHKSKRSFKVIVTGTPGHSSRAPEFVNAVAYGARLIVKIQDIGNRLSEGASDALYDTAHSTAHIGPAAGGTSLNIVPENFEFEFEFRTIAADDPDLLTAEVERYAFEELLPEMKRISEIADIRFEETCSYPGIDIAADAPASQAVMAFAGVRQVCKVAFGTEGGLFQDEAHIPTLVCGPGDIAQAHRPDEYVEAQDLAKCETMLRRLINACC